MSAAVSALTTLSLTDQATAIYIQRMENLRFISDFFLLCLFVGVVFSGMVNIARFIIFIVKKIYKYVKERSLNDD